MKAVTKSKINTLKYWYTEEFLIPKSLQEVSKIKEKSYLTSERGTINEILSHIEKIAIKPSKGYEWSFTVYGCVYPVDNIRKTIERHIPETKDNSYVDIPPKEVAATYAISFSPACKYISNSFQLSTAPWAISHIIGKNYFPDLDYKHLKI